ncbi:FHA domain-containing protein [Naumannella cuiyingiana]|uniref:PSer/pThr/pTyr-binding forkhead associated (FHA) protein n=1 Tax=Naumannella cuiyingiana TaxID=1347891 RepID=A0A7Z0DC75_9ACTN|nr:FHA domain-containing protein [Naumannella cuiyingiana]NYI72643.1 pSer/pThr/pTyr-binding forkhead associated (FHA) protein [Naumannella cuiyingiana]
MPYCTHCGHNNPDGANFCARCGEPMVRPADAPDETEVDALGGDNTRIIQIADEGLLAELTEEDEAAIENLPQGSSLLIVHRGPGSGSRFLIDRDTTSVGRHPDADIFFDDITVSRHHAELQRTEGGVLVKDQGSLNGTYVNRALIDGEAPLKSGDEVQIGKFRMVYFASARGVG